MEYTEQEIIGMSEAYGMYSILPKEDQEKIPQDFVKKIKQYAKPELGYPINTAYSLNSDELSDEGVMLMAYMCMFLK